MRHAIAYGRIAPYKLSIAGLAFARIQKNTIILVGPTARITIVLTGLAGTYTGRHAT